MSTLSAAYIANHAGTVHTYDSFGRQLVSSILAQAQEKLGSGEADEVAVQMEFRVTPSGHGCLYIWNGQWKVHVLPGPVLD